MEHERSPGLYLPRVDGMRAIAVIAVIVFHLKSEWLPGGFSGVDIFFVISGFVVSASVQSYEVRSFREFVAWFLSKRCFRIVPMLALVLVATSMASTLLIPDAWLSDGIHRTGQAATFGWANLSLANRTDSYFSPTVDFNPFVHAWSLGVEEQFYLLFPFILWPWMSRKSRRGAILACWTLAAICSFAYAWTVQSKGGSSAFYLLECRAWELLAGVLLFHARVLAARRTSGRTFVAHEVWLPLIGLLLVGYGLSTSSPDRFPAPGALPAVVGASLLLIAPDTSWLQQMLAFRPFRLIGRMSYSLYLWHWPVFVLFRWTVGLESAVTGTAALTVTAVLASLSRYLVERPVLRFSKRYEGPRIRPMAWSLLALIGVNLLEGLLHHYRWSISLSQVARRANDWYPTIKGRGAPGPCAVPKPSVNTMGKGRRITYTRSVCSQPGDESIVFVVGDSHALAFGRMFQAYASRSGRKVVLYDNAGCGYLTLRSGQEHSTTCHSSSQQVTEEIVRRIRPGDVVFLPSLRMPRFVDQWTRYPRDEVVAQALHAGTVARDSGAVDAAIRVVSRFTGKGGRVVFEAPNLLLNAPAYRCTDPWTHLNPICDGGVGMNRVEFLRLRRPMLDAVGEVARAVSGVSVFDPFPLLCPEGPVCTGFFEGRPLFFDADHISGFGNDVLLPGFEEALRVHMAPEPRKEAASG